MMKQQKGTATRGEKFLNSFAADVFNDTVMKERLPAEVYQKIEDAASGTAVVDLATAEHVASALKQWAMEKGVVSYTHWFQPMRPYSGTKDVYFIALKNKAMGSRELLPIAKFSGKQLLQGETDGSSFPNGGLRGTSNARGYIAWDPTSYPFIMHKCLYVPAVFGTMHGQTLSPKLALLRSETSVVMATKRFLKLLQTYTPSKAIHDTHVRSCVGLEQEIFVVDRELYLKRPDLVHSGRTVIGAPPMHGQQLSNHYWGPIPARVRSCLRDAHAQLLKMGVPVTQIHNEVAPAQFEMVPYHGPSALAVDQNALMMQVLEEVCEKHGLACLLHEKPFQGVNGSGKHVNWSIDNNNGTLFDPGHNPAENLPFMFLLAAFIRACDMHHDLLRASIAIPGNQHRLGGMEAPPGIITVYTGEDLAEVIEATIAGRKSSTVIGKETLDFGTPLIPRVQRDMCDRNRTSPMAFTGNRFEFRAVGSSQDCATPIMVINTIMAESVQAMCDVYESDLAKEKQKDEATATRVMQQVIRTVLAAHRRIVYNGDCYSKQYRDECERRGLPDVSGTAKALALWDTAANRSLFSSMHVLSGMELGALAKGTTRFFCRSSEIEARACLELARSVVLPAAIKYQQVLGEATKTAKQIAGSSATEPQKQLLVHVTKTIAALIKAIDQLNVQLQQVLSKPSGLEQAMMYQEKVFPAMQAAREQCDKLEQVVDGAMWPIPKYNDLLWMRLGAL